MKNDKNEKKNKVTFSKNIPSTVNSVNSSTLNSLSLSRTNFANQTYKSITPHVTEHSKTNIFGKEKIKKLQLEASSFRNVQENRVSKPNYEFNNITTDPTTLIQEKLKKGLVDYTELPDLKEIFSDNYDFDVLGSKVTYNKPINKISHNTKSYKKFDMEKFLNNKEEMLLMDPEDSFEKLKHDEQNVKKLETWENEYLLNETNNNSQKFTNPNMEGIKLLNQIRENMIKYNLNDPSEQLKSFVQQTETELSIILMMNVNLSKKKFNFGVFKKNSNDEKLNKMFEKKLSLASPNMESSFSALNYHNFKPKSEEEKKKEKEMRDYYREKIIKSQFLNKIKNSSIDKKKNVFSNFKKKLIYSFKSQNLESSNLSSTIKKIFGSKKRVLKLKSDNTSNSQLNKIMSQDDNNNYLPNVKLSNNRISNSSLKFLNLDQNDEELDSDEERKIKLSKQINTTYLNPNTVVDELVIYDNQWKKNKIEKQLYLSSLETQDIENTTGRFFDVEKIKKGFKTMRELSGLNNNIEEEKQKFTQPLSVTVKSSTNSFKDFKSSKDLQNLNNKSSFVIKNKSLTPNLNLIVQPNNKKSTTAVQFYNNENLTNISEENSYEKNDNEFNSNQEKIYEYNLKNSNAVKSFKVIEGEYNNKKTIVDENEYKNRIIKSFFNLKNYFKSEKKPKPEKIEIKHDDSDDENKFSYFSTLAIGNNIANINEKSFKKNKFVVSEDMSRFSNVEKYREIIKDKIKIENTNRKEIMRLNSLLYEKKLKKKKYEIEANKYLHDLNMMRNDLLVKVESYKNKIKVTEENHIKTISSSYFKSYNKDRAEEPEMIKIKEQLDFFNQRTEKIIQDCNNEISEIEMSFNNKISDKQMEYDKLKSLIINLEEDTTLIKADLELFCKEQKSYYLNILLQGYDVRQDGIVWVVKRLIELNTTLDIAMFPKFFDLSQIEYIINLAYSQIESIQLKIVLKALKSRQKNLLEDGNESVMRTSFGSSFFGQTGHDFFKLNEDIASIETPSKTLHDIKKNFNDKKEMSAVLKIKDHLDIRNGFVKSKLLKIYERQEKRKRNNKYAKMNSFDETKQNEDLIVIFSFRSKILLMI